MNNRNKRILIIFLSLLLVLGIGSSLAYLRSDAGSQNNNNIKVANLNVDLITDITSLEIDKMYPMVDSEGLHNTSNTFAIKNKGDVISSYKVSLIDKTTVSTLKNSDVRYRLTKKVGNNETEVLEIKNLDESGLIDSGTIDAGVTITYELIMWQDFNSTSSGVVFSKVLLVEGTQVASLDISGANYPELLDNMIAVYYDKTSDTEGVWKKADSKNLNSTYQWFDYNTGMWANAVTVKENGINNRKYYLEAEVGTEISMDDITSMWVWIPRYKYTLFNANNGTLAEQMINVSFEHGIEKTGTVTCSNNILTSTTSNTSETCTDKNGSIENNKSTYTHPAFTFGDNELTGFWIGKFEASTDDQDCTTTVNSTNCNKNTLNILIKPLNKSLRYISIYNMFINSRNMEIYNNIHGFINNESATFSDSTGQIAEDSNELDTHMIKNMEWGAVAYLSQSQYGKYGNSLYDGVYKEVYINNNSNYLTGYSGSLYNSTSSTTATYAYNDLTDQGSGKGYRGAGSSTTGNIYGVFDMSGGVGEYVMGNIVNSSNAFNVSSATTWTTSVYPNEKYYDKYSYNSSSTNYNSSSVSRGKLGDGTREVVKSWATSGRWNGDYNYFPYGTSYSWFARGGYMSQTTYAGVFTSSNQINGAANQYYGSRPVLAINRDMPWLNN